MKWQSLPEVNGFNIKFMNVLSLLTQMRSQTKAAASFLIISLLLSAFPVAFFVAEAADTLYGPESTIVENSTEFSSAVIDASSHENLMLTFNYDAEALDSIGPDVFTYGWRTSASDTVLGTVDGINEGSAGDETGSVSFSLPVGAQVADLVIYMSLASNTSGPDDQVLVTDLTVTGDVVSPTPYAYPSTNEDNETNGHGYVEFISATPSDITLDFVNPDSYVMCFEYRTDGDTGEILTENGGENYNTAVLDGLYPYYCLNDETETHTILADEYVEVRSAFGAERDTDFDWTRFYVAEPKIETAIEITGDTSAGENQPGWLFNRDVANATPIEFNFDEKVIGAGSLNVLPISDTDAPRKFIGEYFWNGAIADLDKFSYNFKIGAGGADTDSEQFYLNVYANFAESADDKYYDCKYDVVPTNGSTASFATVTFDPTQSYPVTKRGDSPYDCPAAPADMGTGSTIRAFAINTGDESLSDSDLNGYFDKVVLETTSEITTFDFEPKAPIEVQEYSNEFESNTDDWTNYGGTITQTDSGTDGIVSQCGDSHAVIDGSVFSRWGGYADTFPTNGYTTEIDVYLDMALADSSDKGFDFSSAINTTDVDAQRRDFIFNLETNASNAGTWLVNANNNAPGNPSDQVGSAEITQTGWYTLQAYFHDNGSGVLEVTMNVINRSNDSVVFTKNLSNSSDIIGSTVGGNRYGWFTAQRYDVGNLAIDNAALYLGAPKARDCGDQPVDNTDTGSTGGSSSGTRVRQTSSPTPQVLGVSTDASLCPFITTPLQIGAVNSSFDVSKLQIFLNIFKGVYGGTENPVTGVFGTITDANVKAFQMYYQSEVLDPWFKQGIVPHNNPTGFVYKTTQWKINDILCPGQIAFPSLAGETLATNVDNNVNE